MFSIILPVYNGATVVETAIQCVFQQTYPTWELIIVNDGSTDDTYAVLAKYETHPQIRIIHQQNKGVSGARNTGIEAAAYPYLAFIDADDLWKENHLATLADRIEKYPDAGLIGTFTETLLANGEMVTDCPYFDGKPETVYLPDFLGAYAADKRAKMFTVITTCCRTEAAKKVGGFRQGCKIGEDLALSLAVAAYYPTVLTSAGTAVYRRTLSVATKDVSFDPDWYFFDEAKTICEDESIPPEKRDSLRRLMEWFSIRRCRHYLIDGRKGEAKKVHKSLGKTAYGRDMAINRVLLWLPTSLVKKIFLYRWRSQA